MVVSCCLVLCVPYFIFISTSPSLPLCYVTLVLMVCHGLLVGSRGVGEVPTLLKKIPAASVQFTTSFSLEITNFQRFTISFI